MDTVPQTINCVNVLPRTSRHLHSHLLWTSLEPGHCHCAVCPMEPHMNISKPHTHTHTNSTALFRDYPGESDSEWQWHQLGHMQVCTSLQKDNHASTHHSVFFYTPDALPATQPTASKHWRHNISKPSVNKSNRGVRTLISHHKSKTLVTLKYCFSLSNSIKWYACMVYRCGHRGYT